MKRGLTLEAVATKIGVSASYIGLIENDSRDPGRELLFKLAAALSVSAAFLETGDLQPEDQAKIDRQELWPEITYFLSNHLLIPRGLGESGLPSHAALRRAATQAWTCRTYCEFYEWAVSRDGRAAATEFSGTGALEAWLETATDGLSTGATDAGWIRFSTEWRDRWTRKGPHADERGAPQHKHISECFAADLHFAESLIALLPWSPRRVEPYPVDLLRQAFVEKAFPSIFMGISKHWSDRRIAGWLWYFDVPLDVFGPLARMARTYSEAADFERSATRLLTGSKPDDMDLILGYFVDIRAWEVWYKDRFKERPLAGRALVMMENQAGFWHPLRRRMERRMGEDILKLKLIHGQGGAADHSAVGNYLEEAARKVASFQISDDGNQLTVERPGGRPIDSPRLAEKPPETLP